MQRLLLYNQHYYPLFRKGSFPHRRILSSQSTVTLSLERPETSQQIEDPKILSMVSHRVTDTRLQGDRNVVANKHMENGPGEYDNSVKEENNKVIMAEDNFNAVDELWGVVDAEQALRLTTVRPELGNPPNPGNINNKLLPAPSHEIGKHISAAGSKPHVAGPLHSTRKIGNEATLTGATAAEPQAHISQNPIAPFAIAAGVAASLTGIFILGVAAVNMFMGKRPKKEQKARKVDFIAE